MAAKKQTQEEEAASRSQMWRHELFVEWAQSEGVNLESQSAVDVIAYFAANRNNFRATDLYRNGVEEHRGEAEAQKAARAEARANKPAKPAKAAKTAKKAPAKKAPTKAAKRSRTAANKEESPFG